MKMADKRHWVFCATLVVSVLPLGNGEDPRLGYVDALKRHSRDCGYPPKETFDNKSLFKKCVEERNVTKVQDICDLYRNEVDRLCDTSDLLEVHEAAKETKMMLNTGLHLCDVAARVKLSPQVGKHLHGETCSSSCSADGAHEVCRLLLILCLTGPAKFLDAGMTPALTTTLTRAPKTTLTANVTAPLTAEPTTSTTTSTTANSTTPLTANSTTGPTAAPPERQTTVATIKADKAGWFKTLLYPALTLVACAILFLIYRKRHQILTCLQDEPESSRTPEDGKGRYRKLPNFQKTVPSLQEMEKAKSFVY